MSHEEGSLYEKLEAPRCNLCDRFLDSQMISSIFVALCTHKIKLTSKGIQLLHQQIETGRNTQEIRNFLAEEILDIEDRHLAFKIMILE